MPQNLHLPNWIWNHIYSPGGGRLPKRPERLGYSGYQPNRKTGGFGTYSPHSSISHSVTSTNWLHSDYFQFYRSRSNVSKEWSMCRVCLTVTWGSGERISHMDNSPRCRKTLFRAFHRLRADQKCAVCNKPTTNMDMCVWLCQGECTDVWKFEEHKGRVNLVHALKLEGFYDYEGDINYGMYCC